MVMQLPAPTHRCRSTRAFSMPPPPPLHHAFPESERRGLRPGGRSDPDEHLTEPSSHESLLLAESLGDLPVRQPLGEQLEELDVAFLDVAVALASPRSHGDLVERP